MLETAHEYFNQFHAVSKHDVEALLQSSKFQSYSKREIITAAGQVQKSLLLVLKGVQRSYYIKEEKEHVIAFTYPVQVSGIPESFFTQTPSRYFLEAIIDTEAVSIPYDHVQKLFDTHPAIERLFRKMTEAILVALLSRHYELLSTTNEERFAAFAARSPHLFQLVPHKYIASYLRIDATNFSKLFNSVRI